MDEKNSDAIGVREAKPLSDSKGIDSIKARCSNPTPALFDEPTAL
jgi:hypothetical protein